MGTAILFVEDNADLRQNAAMVLNMEGYNVRVAGDGREALDILNQGFVPELIVSDIMMPVMDGYEFFQAVRQRNHLKTVPFIFLTALGSRRDVSVGKLMGADDYLVKPFEPEEFLIAIQNKLQRTAEIRAEAVEKLDGARRILVQLLSHELRTPLTYVTGGFALLAEEMQSLQENELTEDVRISLDLIQNGTQRLNRLAEQMVLYAQMLSGFVPRRIRTSGETLEMVQLTYDAQITLLALAQERGIIFDQYEPADDPLFVRGVRDLLVTAISEVLRNAVMFSPLNGTVTLTLVRNGQMAVLTISDQGMGITPEDRATVWEILVQSNRERNEQQGAGMGLPLARGLIEAHGGEIQLDSVPSEGTEVVIRLPLESDDAA
ncbi:MAG: hybrid sensor histidine kinase/response regulator [Anaerolineae bacterium]|nr:hybrid sensor histidine kinase/response regulator [Anaerolineae bacterium]